MIHEFRQTRTDADIDRVVSDLEQFIERNGPADDGIALDLYSEPGKEIHLLGDDGLGQAEFGDAVDQDPAGFMEGLEDGDLMSFGIRSPATVRPDGPEPTTATFLPVGAALGGKLTGTVLPLVVGDRNVRGCRWPRAAPFLPTMHLPSHWISCGQTRPQTAGREFLPQRLRIAPVHVALGEEVDESGDIDTHRTAGDTAGFLALQASRSLFLGHLDGITSRNFKKITGPDLCFLFGHRYPGIFFSLIYNLGHFYLPECTRTSDVLIVENAGYSLLLR